MRCPITMHTCCMCKYNLMHIMSFITLQTRIQAFTLVSDEPSSSQPRLAASPRDIAQRKVLDLKRWYVVDLLFWTGSVNTPWHNMTLPCQGLEEEVVLMVSMLNNDTHHAWDTHLCEQDLWNGVWILVQFICLSLIRALHTCCVCIMSTPCTTIVQHYRLCIPTITYTSISPHRLADLNHNNISPYPLVSFNKACSCLLLPSPPIGLCYLI